MMRLSVLPAFPSAVMLAAALTVAPVFAPLSAQAATAAPAADGWIDLQRPEAWRRFHADSLPRNWRFDTETGVLTRTGLAGDIVTRVAFCDFEFALDWRIERAGNSGVFYRATEAPRTIWHHAPEMQVLDNAAHNDGRNTMTSAGSLYAVYAPARDATRPVGEWNSARIVARGDSVEHWLNDVLVVAYRVGSEDFTARVAASKFREWPAFGLATCGLLGLQDHGDRVQFRNLRVRPLAR